VPLADPRNNITIVTRNNLICVIILCFVDYQIDYIPAEVLQLEEVQHNHRRTVEERSRLFENRSTNRQYDHKPFHDSSRYAPVLRTRPVMLQRRTLVLGSPRNHGQYQK